MKYISKLFYLIAVAAILVSVSCKEEDVFNKWNASYVYLQAKDYLKPNYDVLGLKYSLEGMSGDTAFWFKVKIQKVPEKDIKVNLGIEGVDGTDVSCMNLSNNAPVIKAGEMESEEIKLTFGDYSFIPDTIDTGSFKINLRIMSIETEQENTAIGREGIIPLTINGEGKATYIGLGANDLDSDNSVSLRLNLDNNEIGGDTTFIFNLVTKKAIDQDVRVGLELEGVDGFDVSNIKLDNYHPVIEAGKLESEDIKMSFTNHDFINETSGEKTFKFIIKIASLETDLSYVNLDNSTRSIDVTIEKPAVSQLEAGAPENSELISDRSVWDVEVESGVENGPENLVDNNTGSDVAVNNKGFWVTVDLKQKTKVTGIRTLHWATMYAPTRVKISISDNGSDWESMGEISVSGAEQIIRFKETKETQHIRYDMIDTYSNRVDITEFYIYKLIE